MNIAILSRNPNLYSTRRLVEACESRGHRVKVIDILKCYIDIASNNSAIWYQGEKLESFDAVIPRIGVSVTHYGLAVIRQFEMMSVYCLTDSTALARSRDKLRALQLLSKKGLGLPKTSVAHNVDNANELIKLVGGTPLVLKLSEGTQGRGIVLAETPKAAESVIEAFKELKAEFLVQEFIKEANGCDLRCFVIGNKVVAAMERKAKAGEFRSNLHRGGSATAVKLTALERSTAVKAAQAMGLKIAGVDLLRSSRGPLVMEVNSSPGLEGIEKASGKNIADLIIDYLENNSHPDQKVHS